MIEAVACHLQKVEVWPPARAGMLHFVAIQNLCKVCGSIQM